MIYTQTFDKRIKRDQLLHKLRKRGYKVVEEDDARVVGERGFILAAFYSWKIEKFKTRLIVKLGEKTTFTYKIKVFLGFETPGDRSSLVREMNEIMETGQPDAEAPLESKGLIAVTSGAAWVQVVLALVSFLVLPFLSIIVIIFASISLYQVLKYSKDKRTAGILVLAIVLAIFSKILGAVL